MVELAIQPGGSGMMTDFRNEIDSMGEVRVPADRLWVAQTASLLVRLANIWLS
jgi:uncharacterized membrane-anchored protein